MNRTTRSSSYTNGSLGLTWYNFADGNSPFATGYNLLVKAVVASVTDVERVSEIVPIGLELEQNYPNPFNPTTRIRYAVPGTDHVRLTVYDLMGRAVVTLVDERQGPGIYEAMWDGATASGLPVASGVYFYALESGNSLLSRKMLLVK
jgi:hypothetical protein